MAKFLNKPSNTPRPRMWVMEEQTLCTLLRLCHILSTYPIVCLAADRTYDLT